MARRECGGHGLIEHGRRVAVVCRTCSNLGTMGISSVPCSSHATNESLLVDTYLFIPSFAPPLAKCRTSDVARMHSDSCDKHAGGRSNAQCERRDGLKSALNDALGGID